VIGILTVWLLGLAGVEPSDEQLHRLTTEHQQRGHHAFFEFGGLGGTLRQAPGLALGWEYIADRPFHGVGVETMVTLYGNPFIRKERWWLSGGVSYWPTRDLAVILQAGPLINRNGTELYARGGLAYRTHFFHLTVRFFVTGGQTTEGDILWTAGGRIEY